MMFLMEGSMKCPHTQCAESALSRVGTLMRWCTLPFFKKPAGPFLEKSVRRPSWTLLETMIVLFSSTKPGGKNRAIPLTEG